ncbi:hypothetical protein [Mucilaginibacter sp. SP1R1]|uniref:TapB family protein n=1 Tax=Mucilaginibacter sp. SP1R1 TaxID=2723091 RepID=UPI001617888A|nr:hypothetical protein [Mucilaginibacter sp. SP1R1]MBB6148634.1 archaellum component FlaF (FlaF/FlaG flagellin family) [Mucilaginibacter sp. SP1R1]
MKKVLLVSSFLVWSLQFVSAQNCSQFVGNVNGKKLVYLNKDAKGNEQGKVTVTATKKDASTVSVHSEAFDKNGKSIGGGDSEMICNGDAIKIDMKAFIPASSMKQFSNMQMTGDAKYLAYPLNLSAGQKLDDGAVTIDISNNGQSMSQIQMDITNRVVDKAETVSTNAGSFDCFRITYDAAMKIKMMGIGIPVHIKAAEWFAPKLGRFVKSETYNKNSKLMGSMVLDSIN